MQLDDVDELIGLATLEGDARVQRQIGVDLDRATIAALIVNAVNAAARISQSARDAEGAETPLISLIGGL